MSDLGEAALMGNTGEGNMNTYEYTFGVYVHAHDEQGAWEQVRSISEALDEIDCEDGSAVDGPFLVTPNRSPRASGALPAKATTERI